MKICSKCRESKPRDQFYQDRSNKDGLRYTCIPCDRARENPETLRAWREANREKLRLAAAKRYREKKELIDNQLKQHLTTPRGRAVQLVGSARQRAKKRGYLFDLTNEMIAQTLMSGYCEKSGLPFNLRPRSDMMRNPFAPSIDRVNNHDGYTRDNSVVVCNLYNTGKGEAPDIDFIAMCVAVAERHADDPAVIQRLKELRNAEF